MRDRRSFSIGDATYTPSGFRRLSKARQTDLLIEWFGEHYEDPVHRLPYNSREGGYQWIHGGPYTASDVLEEEFGGLAKASAIQAAIEEVEYESLDWSPKPEIEEDDGIYSINEPLPDIANFDFVEDDNQETVRSDVAGLRRDMLTRLDELESLIRAARPPHGGIGHNNPPVPIDDLPVRTPDLDRSLQAIQSLRKQADADEPDEAQVLRSVSWFRRAAGVLGRWLADRANAVVDTVVASAVPVGLMTAVVAYGKQLWIALESAATSAADWLVAVMPLF